MERITKGLLVLTLFFMASLVGTEGGRDVPNPPHEEVYNPQIFWGLGPFGGGQGWGHGGLGLGLGLGGILPLIGGLPFLGGGHGHGIGGGLPWLGGLDGKSKSSARNDVVSVVDGIGKMMEPAPSTTHN